MQHGQDEPRRLFLRRVSLFVLSGLLSWTQLGYSGGPIFEASVTSQRSYPGFFLGDSDKTEADWYMQSDVVGDEAFSVGWGDEGRGRQPLVIENRAPDNALYIDAGGNLGIGTAAPRASLHIVHPSIAEIRLETIGIDYTWDILANDLEFAVRDVTSGDFPFSIGPAAGNSSLRIARGGNIGIGTPTPLEAVEVFRRDTASRFQLTSVSDDPTHAPQFIQRRARGGQPRAPVQDGDNLGLFSFRGMRPNGKFSGSQATMTAQATEDWTNTARGTNLVFGTTQNGTSSVRSVMELTHDGRVLINGTQLTVPDYVFADDYELMPLEDLQAYIEEHHHLPEIAGEAEVKQAGVDLGGTQMALLKKVEELTLYTLQQHEQLAKQEKHLADLEGHKAVLRYQNAELSHQLTVQTTELRHRLVNQQAAFEERLAALEQQLQTPSH